VLCTLDATEDILLHITGFLRLVESLEFMQCKACSKMPFLIMCSVQEFCYFFFSYTPLLLPPEFEVELVPEQLIIATLHLKLTALKACEVGRDVASNHESVYISIPVIKGPRGLNFNLIVERLKKE
jgi:hypothetical protein